MKTSPWPIAVVLLAFAAVEVQAQVILPIPGNFATYTYKKRNLTVNGYVFEPYPMVVSGVGPFGPVVINPINPYAIGPLGGYSPFLQPLGSVNSRVTIQYITPAVMVGSSRQAPEYDLAGVNLDVILAQNAAKAKDALAAAPPPPNKAENPPAKGGKLGVGAEVAKLQPPEPRFKLPDPPPAAKANVPVPPIPNMPPPKKDQADEHNRLIELGLTSFRGQEYGLAAKYFQQATAAQPKVGRAYFYLAQAQFALGKYREASAAIEAGMVRFSDWPQQPFHPRLNLYQGREEDFLTQVKRLENAVTNHPGQAAYLFVLAYQLWFDGRRQEAGPVFQRARVLTPDPIAIDAFLRAGDPGVVAAQ